MKKGTRKRRKSAAQKPARPAHQRPLSIGGDSGASNAISQPSSFGVKRSGAGDYFNDRGYQQAAIDAVNAFLKKNSGPVERLEWPHHSAKDITETLIFLLARLDYPTTESELDEDLPIMLKVLKSPFTLTKSVLRAPGNPHYWPIFLAIIHWLVHLLTYSDHMVASKRNTTILFDNDISKYTLESYRHYLSGDDVAVDELDRVQILKAEEERDSAVDCVNQLKEEVIKLEANLEGLRTRPSAKEALEKQISLSEDDIKKFRAIIIEFSGRTANLERELDKKVKELEAKVEENNKICEENKELKKMIELQVFNVRDAERMKQELQAVEKDTREAESARNAWEEKSWDLDGTITHKFKELEGLSMECNQALRRLKLGINIQYSLNSKGTTPADVLGIDYKAEIKPALDSLRNDIKKSSMERLEELIFLQRQSAELVSKIKEKRNQITAVDKHVDEVELNLSLLKKEMEDHISRCELEKQRLVQDFETEAHNLDNAEKEAADMLMAAKLNLQNTIKQTEEEIQKCALELYGLVDCVSKCKQHTSSKIDEMRDELSQTAAAVSKAYQESLPAQFRGLFDESKLDESTS